MIEKEMEPADIGKHPTIIKKAQNEMAEIDVLVCGRCYSIFYYVELFQSHKDLGCDKNKELITHLEDKPKIWAYLLWKNSKELTMNEDFDAWKLYQTWINLDETLRETWLIAGRTIQSFAKIGQGILHEMPVRITKTVIDSTNDATNKILNKSNDSKDEESKGVLKKVDTNKIVRKPNMLTSKTSPITKIMTKPINRRAKRTTPNTGGQEIEEAIIEKIIAKRYNPRRKLHEYLIKWECFAHDQNTWEPRPHLENCEKLVDLFEKQLAKQKEQRALLGATKIVQQDPKITYKSPNAFANALMLSGSKTKSSDDIKSSQEDEKILKRKLDTKDFDDTLGLSEDQDFEDAVIPTHTLKKLKNGNAVAVSVKNPQVNVLPRTPTVIKTVNGQRQNPAEVQITKGSNFSGIIAKTSGGFNNMKSTKPEAQVRIVSRGENVKSGIVRIVPSKNSTNQRLVGAKTNTISPLATTPNKTIITYKDLGKGSINSPRSLTSSGPRVLQSQPKTTIIDHKRPISAINSNSQNPQSKSIVNRVFQTTPVYKNISPEQRILQLSKSGDLKVTKKLLNSREAQQEQILTLPEKSVNVYQESENASQALELNTGTGNNLEEQQNVENMEQAEEITTLTLVGDDQQLLTNEDGTPILVTGDDGTIYQVAGKNEEGQTILIAQGNEGQQQFTIVTSEENGEEAVLTIDNSVAEAVAQMMPEQQGEGTSDETNNFISSETTQFIIKQNDGNISDAVINDNGTNSMETLTIHTTDSGDTPEGNIAAQVYQTNLPSPGGTRQVVLLLQDGSLMMTQMHDDECRALNIV